MHLLPEEKKAHLAATLTANINYPKFNWKDNPTQDDYDEWESGLASATKMAIQKELESGSYKLAIAIPKQHDDPDVTKFLRDMRSMIVKDGVDACKAYCEEIFTHPDFNEGRIDALLLRVRESLPDTVSEANKKKRYQGFRDIKNKAHAQEWEKYAPWLDQYFIRNSNHPHSLTDGRKACAKHFGRNYKTIERRTKGYSKPPDK